jgi:DNA-binding response OmpR family regulator
MSAMDDANRGAVAPASRIPARPRIAVIDRDAGFMQVLSNRLSARGWEHRSLSSAVRLDVLLAMRLNAVVLDVEVIGPEAWDYLERVCSRLPGMAVIVCSAPASVSQRVRGLRLGVDAWMSKP